MQFILFLTLFFISLLNPSFPIVFESSQKIQKTQAQLADGDDAVLYSHPHQVQIVSTHNPKFFCTGALINHSWVLSVEACVFDELDFPLMVVSGSHRLILPEVTWQIRVFNHEDITIHPESNLRKNGPVLIHVTPPFKLDGNTSTIQMPPNVDYDPGRVNVTLSGWGTPMDDDHIPELAEVTLPLRLTPECELEYQDQEFRPDFRVNHCAGSSDSGSGLCQGDFGAPLEIFDDHYHKKYLLGLGSGMKKFDCTVIGPNVSFPCNCIPQNRPDRFVKVASYRSWIRDKIEADFGTTEMPIDPPPTTPNPDDFLCETTDARGILWKGRLGEVVIKSCMEEGGSREGHMSWECLLSGSFKGSTPYYGCNSPWVYHMDQYRIGIDYYRKLHANSELDIENGVGLASNLLQKMSSVLRSAILDPSIGNKDQFFGQEIPDILELTSGSIGLLKCKPVTGLTEFKDLGERTTKYELMTLGNLLKNSKSWDDIRDDFGLKAELGTRVIRLMEQAAFELPSRIDQKTLLELQGVVRNEFFDANIQRLQVLAGVEHQAYEGEGPMRFPQGGNGSYIELPPNWKTFLNSGNATSGCNFNQGVKYGGILVDSTILAEKLGLEGQGSYQMNSDILTFAVAGHSEVKVPLQGGSIKLRFKLKQSGKHLEQKCVYWDKEKLVWSEDGCTLNKDESNGEYSVCDCTHLTTFAILMGNRVHENIALEILTITLCAGSNLALLATIFILQGQRKLPGSIPSIQATILTNLCSTLFVGNIFFVLLNPTYFDHLPKGACMTIGILASYFYLSAYSWMAIFGWQVYRLMVLVFNSHNSFTIYKYSAIGFGAPFILISIVGGVGRGDAYYFEDNSPFCWLKDHWIWAFLAPVLIISIMNVFVLSLTLKKLYNMNYQKDVIRSNQSKMQKPNIKGFISLSILLGITWIPGFFYLVDENSAPLANFSAYMFTILNGSQGILIFAFQYALRNRRIRLLKDRSQMTIITKNLSSRSLISSYNSLNSNVKGSSLSSNSTSQIQGWIKHS